MSFYWWLGGAAFGAILGIWIPWAIIQIVKIFDPTIIAPSDPEFADRYANHMHREINEWGEHDEEE